jgi:hypothetical protein
MLRKKEICNQRCLQAWHAPRNVEPDLAAAVPMPAAKAGRILGSFRGIAEAMP